LTVSYRQLAELRQPPVKIKKGGGGGGEEIRQHIRITCRWRKTIHDSHDSATATKTTPKFVPSLFYLFMLSTSVYFLSYFFFFYFYFIFSLVLTSLFIIRPCPPPHPTSCTHTSILFVFLDASCFHEKQVVDYKERGTGYIKQVVEL
jgi:hypothetical protein